VPRKKKRETGTLLTYEKIGGRETNGEERAFANTPTFLRKKHVTRKKERRVGKSGHSCRGPFVERQFVNSQRRRRLRTELLLSMEKNDVEKKSKGEIWELTGTRD